jgi:hypothetical protein
MARTVRTSTSPVTTISVATIVLTIVVLTSAPAFGNGVSETDLPKGGYQSGYLQIGYRFEPQLDVTSVTGVHHRLSERKSVE